MMHRRIRTAALAALVLSLLTAELAGCAAGPSQTADPAEPSPTMSSQADPSRVDTGDVPVQERCRDASFSAATVTELTFETRDGVELFAAALGDGDDGLLLMHGTGRGALCNWATAAAALANDGFTVLAIDHRCQGYSGCGAESATHLDRDALAASEELRSRGARTVTLLGESRGGAVALAAAAAAAREAGGGSAVIDAVVALSAVERDKIYSGDEHAPLDELVAEIEVPVLYLMSRDDRAVQESTQRALADATPTSSLIVYDDRGHGARMLGGDGMEAPYRDDLMPFLTEN